VGAKAESYKTLKKAINSLEKANDQNLVWRKYVNKQLKTKYKELYSNLNCMIYLKAKNFSLLQKWRLKQENKLWLKSKNKIKHKIMSKGDVINFMQTYQRITQNMFKNAPKYFSIILNLNSNHQIKSIKYNK
jgi:D-glycerate 3-kinase